MIKTKSRLRGCEQQKYLENMRAGFDNNPALQNLQRLILGLTD